MANSFDLFFFSFWYAWVQFPNIFAHDVLCTALSVMPDMIFDTHTAKLYVVLNPDLFAIQDQHMICLILPGRCVDFGQFLYTMLENQRGRLSHSTKRQHRHCWSLLGLAPGNISRPEQLLLLRDPGGSAKGSYKMKFLNNIWPGGSWPPHTKFLCWQCWHWLINWWYYYMNARHHEAHT